MKYIHILIFLLTNMFASEVGALIQSDSGRDCPPGQLQDCSEICWPEFYFCKTKLLIEFFLNSHQVSQCCIITNYNPFNLIKFDKMFVTHLLISKYTTK